MEFALVFPLVLLMILGTIEAGRLLLIYSMVTSASREAARYAATVDNFNDCTGIRDAAKRIANFAGVNDSSVTIEYDRPTPGHYSTTTPYATNCPATGVLSGDRILVTVRAWYEPIVPLGGFPKYEIRSFNVHTIVRDVEIYKP